MSLFASISLELCIWMIGLLEFIGENCFGGIDLNGFSLGEFIWGIYVNGFGLFMAFPLFAIL